MAGHSKWANTKHRKARVDEKKGKIFTKLAREIIVAAREGGGDLNANRLRLVVQKARENNMPNDNIQRAIAKGTGGLEGESYEEATYEGYGSGGVAVLLDILTDNRNRTVADIRHIFSRHGGNLGESGCVAWMFDRKGSITVNGRFIHGRRRFFMIALEAGAEDEKRRRFLSHRHRAEQFETVKNYLEEQKIKISSSEVTMLPKQP